MFSAILSKINPLVVIIVMLLALAGGLGMLYKNSLEDLVVTKGKLETAEQDYKDLKTQADDEALRHIALNDKVLIAQTNFNSTKAELNKMKGRQDLIRKKSGLVEIKINKSFKQFQDDVACLTGGAKCE